MNITQVLTLLKDLSLDINDERLDASIKALELLLIKLDREHE